MKGFAQWFRRASAGQRAIAVVAVLGVLALIGWIVAPSSSSKSTSAAASTGRTHGCPSGTDQGVSGNQVAVAITVIELKGAVTNAAVNVPSAEDQEAYWRWVADDINKSGGGGCHQLALHFFRVNPIDANGAQQKCLDLAASHPFIALDSGSLTNVGASDCIPAQQIPLVSTGFTAAQLKKYAPYYLALGDIANDTLRNGILGLKQLGYFSSAKGFSKLGFIYQTCLGQPTAARQALSDANVPDSKIVSFSFGCPPGRASRPADLEQAVLKFKTSGVTTVFEYGVNDFAAFTKVAQQQGFKPQYALADDAFTRAGTTGSAAPDVTNLDGAVDVVSNRYSEDTTPGYQPTGATVRCSALFAAKGQPPVYKQPSAYGGVTCAFLSLVKALLDHAPSLQRSALIQGMHDIGRLDLPYPYGPVDYSAAPAGSGYGVSFWRSERFSKSCACWRVTDPAFHAPQG